MDKKNFIYISCFIAILLCGTFLIKLANKNLTKEINVTIVSNSSGKTVVKDINDNIYTLNFYDEDISVNDNILIKYTGILDLDKDMQEVQVISYTVIPTSVDTDSNTSLVSIWDDNGIFKDFYSLAKGYLNSLTLDQKIGQLLLVKYPGVGSGAVNALKDYNLAGYIFYENDFKDKTKYEVIKMIEELQEASKTPILTAVDEEGGSVVRVSSNSNLIDAPFKSPSYIYEHGGIDAIKDDTTNKSKFLSSLGINLNLAPVVDVSSDSNSYIYERTLKEDTETTSLYAKTVINASKDSSVSYVLKHFPGYGNNTDTHTGSSTDNRSYDDIRDNDLPPFISGIEAGAEAILVSHNVVTNIDDGNPASLSEGVHNLLRKNLGFTGVIISDDLSMSAVSNISNNIVKAIKAGNDLIIVSDYLDSINSIKDAISDSSLTEDDIDIHVARVIAWKFYKELMLDRTK